MPVFHYERYTNPYVASISALLQEPGQIEAQRATAVAQAQANAALGSGQAWGNAVQGIGQSIASIPQQMQAQKLQALQMQDIKAQVAERQAVAAQRDYSLKAQQAGEQSIREAIDPITGKVDYEKAASGWEARGFPTQANAYRESVQKTRQTAQALEEGQQKIDAGKKQAAQAQTDHLAELGASGLEKLKTDDPVHARDYAMGLVANAVSHGFISPDDAKQMLVQTASARPEQLAGIYQSLVDASPNVKSRLVEQNLKKAQTEKDIAEAEKARNPVLKEPKQYTVTVPGPGGQPIEKLFSESQLQAGVPKYEKPNQGDKPPDQNKLEQQYRTVLMREVSSRSGTLGTEDAKVVSANHLLEMFHQGYDPNTGEYNIPKVQQAELALGLARMMSPTGQVGIQLEQEINQATAKGDINKALTYITGQPFNGSTQAVFKMFRDSIERQGQVAIDNRQAAIKYLQGLAPTELEPARREALENNTLAPLRQLRLAKGPNGQTKLWMSKDGGKTWE